VVSLFVDFFFLGFFSNSSRSVHCGFFSCSFICGESLVEHAKHAVEARKVALQHWKNMRLKQMKLNGGTTSSTKKTMKNDEIEMVSVNSSNDVAVEGEEELTGNEILNWGGSVDDPTSAAGKGKQ